MRTFVFVWNPKKWNWIDLEKKIEIINQTGHVTEDWGVASFKKIQLGDRFFLLRLGVKPKGIIGSGYISSDVFMAKHWNGDNVNIPKVMLDFDVLINAEIDPNLSIDILNSGDLAKMNWTPQLSGIEMHPDFVDKVESLWFDFLKSKTSKNISEESNMSKLTFVEGVPNKVLQTRYERNPYARRVCLDFYGLSCKVCGLNFEDKYGQIGKDFIHVHHLFQISSIGKEYEVDPIRDLRPVCPNCHAMLHKKRIPYTIEEIIEAIKEPAKNTPQ